LLLSDQTDVVKHYHQRRFFSLASKCAGVRLFNRSSANSLSINSEIDEFRCVTLTELARRYGTCNGSTSNGSTSTTSTKWRLRPRKEREAMQMAVEEFRRGQYLGVVVDYEVKPFFGFSLAMWGLDGLLGERVSE
jgi:hypothetical protein